MATNMRLRQICLVAGDLARVEEELCGIFGLEVGERDPGVGKWGLHNFLLPIGGDFLEVVAPTEDGTSAGRLLQRRGGDGGYMTIFQCDDGLASRERITSRGVRLIWGPERDDYVPSQYHPRDCLGTILAVGSVPGMDRHDEMSHWPAAGEHWRPHVHREVTQAMVGAEMQNDDPKAAAAFWSDLLDTPARETGPDQFTLSFDNAELRFVKTSDGRGDGLGGLDLKINDMAHVQRAAAARGIACDGTELMVCGTRIRLVQ